MSFLFSRSRISKSHSLNSLASGASSHRRTAADRARSLSLGESSLGTVGTWGLFSTFTSLFEHHLTNRFDRVRDQTLDLVMTEVTQNLLHQKIRSHDCFEEVLLH